MGRERMKGCEEERNKEKLSFGPLQGSSKHEYEKCAKKRLMHLSTKELKHIKCTVTCDLIKNTLFIRQRFYSLFHCQQSHIPTYYFCLRFCLGMFSGT
jgi:hypothetical protein